jgi:hypothetical protein
LRLLEQAIGIAEEVLGHENPDTRNFRVNLNMVRQRYFITKKSGILQAIPLLEKALGVNHSITQAKRQELNPGYLTNK